MIKKITAVFLAFVTILSLTQFAFASFESVKPYESGFIPVEGTEIEYCVYGEENEQPLLVLTGNGGDMHGHDGNILPGLVSQYKVICVSVRGTGNTKLGTEHLTFEMESADLTAVLDYLKIDKTYVYGFSDGANLAIVFTLLYPERVSKLCIQSPNINVFGTKTIKQMTIIWQYIILCIETTYKSDPEYVRQREIKGMMAHQPNLKFSDLKNINVPTLHIYAENDMFFKWHSRKISQSIPGCKTLVVEGATHSGAFERSEETLIPALLTFFG